MNITYKTDHDILEVQPSGAMQEGDFDRLKEALQSATAHDAFNGMLIRSKDFPGYEHFSDFIAHGQFVKEAKDRVEKVAVVTDSSVGKLLESLGSALGSAEVKRFDFNAQDAAEKWLLH